MTDEPEDAHSLPEYPLLENPMLMLKALVGYVPAIQLRLGVNAMIDFMDSDAFSGDPWQLLDAMGQAAAFGHIQATQRELPEPNPLTPEIVDATLKEMFPGSEEEGEDGE